MEGVGNVTAWAAGSSGKELGGKGATAGSAS